MATVWKDQGEGVRGFWQCSVLCFCSGSRSVPGLRVGILHWPSQLPLLSSAGPSCLQLEYHTEMQYVSKLSTIPLWNVVRMLVGSEACLFPQKLQSLLGPLHNPSGVLRPVEVIIKGLHYKILNAIYCLHCTAADAEGCILRSWPLEFDHHNLCFVLIEHQVVVSAPALYLLEFFPVCWLISSFTESHNCGIICKLNYQVFLVCGCTV